jgi:hypothetical protein
LLLIYI